MTSVCEQQYPRDNSIFSGREMFAAEMKNIFNNGWICVGTDDRLPVPNSRFVYEDFERSLLITRDQDGQVGAFVNACTHRGTRLCHNDGSGRQIQCPYHGWTFDFGGRLLGVPRRSGCEKFESGDFALKSVKSGLLGRFIFVHTGDEPAPDLRDYVGSMADALEKVSAQLVTYLGEIRLPVKANWKLCVSGMVEDYHTPQVHPRTLNTSRGSASESILRERGHSYYEVKI
ncbi:MAG: aromatic ring-hydroxylating dioxygenase subunit alpha, partial [Planctomycetota bacterium]